MSVPNSAAPAAVSADVSNANSQVDPTTSTENDANSSDVSADVVDPAVAAAAIEAAKKQLKKYKLKVDGKDEDFEVDLNNEEEMRKQFQLAKVGNKRMQEKAELENRMTKFFDILKADPESVLSHPEIGVDLKKFAQSILQKQAQEEAKTPEQKELEAARKQLEDYKRQSEEAKKTSEAAQLKALEDEQEKSIINEMKDAFETVKLPYSPRAVRYMAEYMKIAHDQKIQLTAAEVAPLVKNQMIKDYQEMMRSSPDEVLEEFIGKDISGRLQKTRISKAKTATTTAAQIKATGADVNKKPAEPAKKMTYKEFFKI